MPVEKNRISIVKLNCAIIKTFKLRMDDKEAIKTIGKYSYFMQRCLGEGSFGKVFEGFENNTK